MWLPFFSRSFCPLFSAIILCGGAPLTLAGFRREDFSMAWQPKG
jgi:hypothetical protein